MVYEVLSNVWPHNLIHEGNLLFSQFQNNFQMFSFNWSWHLKQEVSVFLITQQRFRILAIPMATLFVKCFRWIYSGSNMWTVLAKGYYYWWSLVLKWGGGWGRGPSVGGVWNAKPFILWFLLGYSIYFFYFSKHYRLSHYFQFEKCALRLKEKTLWH